MSMVCEHDNAKDAWHSYVDSRRKAIVKKCAYRINVVEDGVTVCEHHYDNAIDAVEAWNSYTDYGHAKIRTLSFIGAAGDMAVKQFKDPHFTLSKSEN